jgi:hypothetical protein
MFQFTHCAPTCLWIEQVVTRHDSGRVASLGILGLIACMQLPPNVSPVSASFFALTHPGIHLVLFVACCVCAPGVLRVFLCGSLSSTRAWSDDALNKIEVILSIQLERFRMGGNPNP